MHVRLTNVGWVEASRPSFHEVLAVQGRAAFTLGRATGLTQA